MNDLRPGLERAGRQAPPIGDDPFERLQRRRLRKSRRERLSAAAVALSLTVVVLGGVLFALRPHDAARVGRVAAGVDLSVGSDQYYYESVTQYSFGPEGDGAHWPLYLTRDVSASWYRADQSGRNRNDASYDFFSAQDRATYLDQFGSPPDTRPSDKTYGPGDYQTDSNGLDHLSTDPVTLHQQLLDRSGTGGSSPEPLVSPGPGQGPETGRLWGVVHKLLDEPNASPSLRGALFEVAKGLQGVDVVPDTTDPVGRPGVRLSLTIEGMRMEFWFDPATEQLLAQRDTVEQSNQYNAAGTVVGLNIVTEAGVANSTTDDPTLVKSFVPAPVSSPPSMPDPRR